MAAAHTRTGAVRTSVRSAVRRALPRAGRWAVNLLMLLVVIGGAAWLAPAALGYSRYVITGGSMTGTYDKGSIVFEKPKPVADLQVGDVITYLPPADSGLSTLVTHRIVKQEPAAGGGVLFTTRGDANPGPDPWHFSLVQRTQPVVQFSVPHAGWIFIALADRQTRMLVVGVPAGIIALLALVELAGALRGGRRDDEASGPADESVDESAVEESRIPVQRDPAHQAPVGAAPVGAPLDAPLDAPVDAPVDAGSARPVTAGV